MEHRQQHTIVLRNVHKYFFLQHQKTLKELVQAVFKNRKTLEKVHALNNISLSIEKGESVGIIGKNGAGKSTLLKLIAGVSSPTSGVITVCGKVVPLIELGAGFHPELTGKENIFLNGVILGMKESYLKEKFSEIVNFAEIGNFIDVPFKFYSTGMKMRLAFSVAVFVNPDILLLDEIMAVGDLEFQKKCLAKMEEFKRKGTTTIFISHNMEAVKNFCDRVIYLREGRVMFDGEVNQGIEMYLNS